MHKGIGGGSRLRNAVWAVFWIALLGSGVVGQGSVDVSGDAGPELGEQRMASHQCETWHARQVAGGNLIHDPASRAHDDAALVAMVRACNTGMSPDLVPDDIRAVAATLDRDYYGLD